MSKVEKLITKKGRVQGKIFILNSDISLYFKLTRLGGFLDTSHPPTVKLLF